MCYSGSLSMIRVILKQLVNNSLGQNKMIALVSHYPKEHFLYLLTLKNHIHINLFSAIKNPTKQLNMHIMVITLFKLIPDPIASPG